MVKKFYIHFYIDIFNEDELNRLRNEIDIIEPSGQSFSSLRNPSFEKEKVKKLLFSIIRENLQKLNKDYLLTSLNWLEQESTSNETSSPSNVNDVKKQNESYRELFKFLENNTEIKLKTEYIAKNNLEHLHSKEISLNLAKQISSGNIRDKNYISPKNSKFITIAEETILNVETQEFNILKLEEEVGAENTLSVIGCYILTVYGLYSKINYDKFEKFIQAITKGYNRENPYHTDLHAADVTQTCLVYIKQAKMKEILNLNELDIASLYISCMVHDYKHPGYTNQFLININSPTSIKSNDIDVLEAYHISQTFKLIRSNEKYDIFSLMNNDEYRIMRKRMIGFVLATDMVFHFKQFEYVKNLIKDYGIEKGKNREKMVENNEKLNDLQQQFLEIIVHACDISNPTKPFHLYTFWAEKVVAEFFRQGDKEKELGLKVSVNCDRLTTSLPQSQIGFMNFIVGPFFISFVDIFPELSFLTDNVKDNTERYKKMKEEDDKKKESNK